MAEPGSTGTQNAILPASRQDIIKWGDVLGLISWIIVNFVAAHEKQNGY